MARTAKDNPKLEHTIPLRISSGMLAEANTAADKLEEEASVMMRLAMRIGFEFLRRTNYDVAGAVIDKVRGRKRAINLAGSQRDRK